MFGKVLHLPGENTTFAEYYDRVQAAGYGQGVDRGWTIVWFSNLVLAGVPSRVPRGVGLSSVVVSFDLGEVSVELRMQFRVLSRCVPNS